MSQEAALKKPDPALRTQRSLNQPRAVPCGNPGQLCREYLCRCDEIRVMSIQFDTETLSLPATSADIRRSESF